MSEIAKEAQKLAEEELPDHLTLPLDEDKIITFFLVSQLGFDEETVREAAVSERQEILKLGTSKFAKILTTRNKHVRQLFTGHSYPELQTEKWIKPYDAFRSNSDQGPSYAGPGEPARKTWRSTVKDPHPDSGLKYRLKDWLDEVPWYEYYDADDDRILAHLDRVFFGRIQAITHLHNRGLNHSWTVQIMIRRKEGD